MKWLCPIQTPSRLRWSVEVSNSLQIESKRQRHRANGQIVGFLIVAAVLLTNITGCGKPTGPVEALVPVSGIALFDGEPVEGIEVTFVPTGSNTARSGYGKTDSEGHFVMFNYQRKEGLPVGDYVVTFTLFRMADGSAPPADKPPMAAGALQVIPRSWNRANMAGFGAPGFGEEKRNKSIKSSGPAAPNLVKVPEDGITDLMFKIPKK